MVLPEPGGPANTIDSRARTQARSNSAALDGAALARVFRSDDWHAIDVVIQSMALAEGAAKDACTWPGATAATAAHGLEPSANGNGRAPAGA